MQVSSNMAATWCITIFCTTLLVYAVAEDGVKYKNILLDLSSYKFLKELNALKPDVSLVCSPVNIFMLLSLYSAWAPEDVQKSITKVRDFDSFKKLRDIEFRLNYYLSNRNENITTGRQIFFRKGLTPTQGFRESADMYGTGVGELDFSKPEEAKDDVNYWADKFTDGMIKEPMTGSGLKDSTVMLMFTVLFFKGQFSVPFKAKDTKDMEFHVNKNKKVTRRMMSLVQSNLHYIDSQELDAKAIVIPFTSYGFRLLLLLPNEVDGLTTLLNKVSERDVLFDVIANVMPTTHEVDILLPRIQIRTKVDAEKVLKKLGLSNFYTSPVEGIVMNQNITLGRVLQEVFVNFDETGATEMPTKVVNPPPGRLTFHATHSFIFSVFHPNGIFYMGIYRG